MRLLTALLFLSPAALAQDVTLTLQGTVDLNSTSDATAAEYIGSNPSAVAWDGTDAFVAGFNNTGSAVNAGIVKVTDALGTASLGAAFGQRFWPVGPQPETAQAPTDADAAGVGDDGTDDNLVVSQPAATDAEDAAPAPAEPVAPREETLAAVSLCLILGGAIGNLIDRILLGHVIDYIQVWLGSYPFPAFNIADAAISVGAVLLILSSFLGSTKPENE